MVAGFPEKGVVFADFGLAGSIAAVTIKDNATKNVFAFFLRIGFIAENFEGKAGIRQDTVFAPAAESNDEIVTVFVTSGRRAFARNYHPSSGIPFRRAGA